MRDRIVLVCAVLLAVVACATSEEAREPRRPGGSEGPFDVLEVVDGDTVEVVADGREVTLRLIGIDTPETDDPDRPVECFGREATAAATSLLQDERVRLTYDGSQGRTDRYGRTLAYLWLPDGRSFQWTMLSRGYAGEYTYDLPYRYQEPFRRAEADARAAGRGLWGADTCGGDLDRPAGPTTTSAGDGFATCDDAHAAGATPVRRGDPGYGPHLDGDGDGVACES